MLKVKRLEISGFKSFVDPVAVDFAGGVTAIVGPNGCGKSNLSDAMTWVLGEQSAKSLRGATMEDVIFNGSDGRKPLGMAEATLHLATDPGFPRSDDGRISISRRVFRGGESQYRLNGRVVRLKEIRDLLMDTGLGLRAYSVIEQGKIGMILSGKPQERRKLIEEAAGITRYKARKGIAEVKLQEATANLLRLDDVISEVERALRSLKRQASAARRYQEKEIEYRLLLEEVLLGRWSLLSARLARLEAEVADAISREAGLAADVHRDEAALAAGRERLDELATEVARRHRRQAELGTVIEGRQQFLKANRQTAEEVLERAAQSRDAAARRSSEIERHAAALGGLEERLHELVADRDLAATEIDEDERLIGEAERHLLDLAKRVESLRSALLAAWGEANALRTRSQQAQIEQERGNFRRHHLDEELAQHAHELQQAAEALALARERVTAVEATLATRAAEEERVKALLEATLRRESEASERKRGLESELGGARQRQRLLAELARAHAERRANLAAALARVGLDPVYLVERARALAGWERSLDFYLGPLADAVLLPAGRTALGLAAELAAGSPGRRPAASLIEPRPPVAAEGAIASAGEARWDTVAEDPAVVLSVGEALGLAPELAAALPPGFLVRTADDAARLSLHHPWAAFLSRDGVWVQAGTFHLEGDVAAPGVLERERELADLGRAIPELEAALAAAAADLERLIAERAGLARDANRLSGEVAQSRQERAVALARQEDTLARHRRLAGQQEALTNEHAEVGRELARIGERQQRVAEELAAAEARHAEIQERFDAAQAEAEAAKAARESLRTASAGRRGRLELLEERLESHRREMKRLGSEVDEGRRQVGAWQEEAERLTTRRTELAAGIEHAEAELQEALEQRAAAEEGVLDEQDRLDLHRQEIRGLEERIQTQRERREGVRAEVEELRVSQARHKQDAEHLALSFEEHFARPLGSVAPSPSPSTAKPVIALSGSDFAIDGEMGGEMEGLAGGEPVDSTASEIDSEFGIGPSGELVIAPEEPPAMPEIPIVPPEPIEPAELARLEAELARCKDTLDRLGPVNVLAVQEHDEQEERQSFLTTQRTDVADSVESLRRTIREINETSSVRFQETFVEVNRAFGEVFARLFRGGEAEMRLLDEEDVLESGIEIVARPPGKRLQNLMLLSGGEKALTAIALLFALFRTKPSPYCILDEVDAPLDDVNTVRFVDLLKEMTLETQFIVITHNKLTMEVASTLYGVTMEEKGVSKLVSVEMEDLQPEERATA